MENFDITKAPLEIERKFLIEYPDIGALRRMADYRVIHIEQSYLSAEDEQIGGRVRRITEGDSVRYIYTCKKRLTVLTRHEYEREISEEEYRELLTHKTPDTITISKDRHIFSFEGLVYELDVYDFWSDKATLEAEVKNEETTIPIPPCVKLIKEVTYDKRYNNSQLVRNLGDIDESAPPVSQMD